MLGAGQALRLALAHHQPALQVEGRAVAADGFTHQLVLLAEGDPVQLGIPDIGEIEEPVGMPQRPLGEDEAAGDLLERRGFQDVGQCFHRCALPMIGGPAALARSCPFAGSCQTPKVALASAAASPLAVADGGIRTEALVWMTLEIRPGITVRRPRREVAAVIFDPRYDESWMETLRPVDPEDVGRPGLAPINPGSIRFLLRDVVVWLRETSREPGRFVEFEADEPYKLWIRQDLESIPEGTLVRMRIRVALTGLPRLLRPLVHRRLRRSVIGDLEALKALVENSPHPGYGRCPPGRTAGGGRRSRAGRCRTGCRPIGGRAACGPPARSHPRTTGRPAGGRSVCRAEGFRHAGLGAKVGCAVAAGQADDNELVGYSAGASWRIARRRRPASRSSAR